MVDSITTTVKTLRHLRHGDVPELLPGAGAVDARRLVELLRHGLQPGEEAHGIERRPRPDHDRDHRTHRVVGIAEPVR